MVAVLYQHAPIANGAEVTRDGVATSMPAQSWGEWRIPDTPVAERSKLRGQRVPTSVDAQRVCERRRVYHTSVADGSILR